MVEQTDLWPLYRLQGRLLLWRDEEGSDREVCRLYLSIAFELPVLGLLLRVGISKQMTDSFTGDCGTWKSGSKHTRRFLRAFILFSEC